MTADIATGLASEAASQPADHPKVQYGRIGVLLMNLGDTDFQVKKGDRIAQMALNLVRRIDDLPIGGDRNGGFGSTRV